MMFIMYGPLYASSSGTPNEDFTVKLVSGGKFDVRNFVKFVDL